MTHRSPSLASFRNRAQVTPISLTATSLVSRSHIGDGPLPLVITPEADIDLSLWIGENRTALEQELWLHGAILFRGFRVTDPSEFERLIRSAAGSALPYVERSSPRSQVEGNIYTSTNYPAQQPIFLHNEQSYNLTFPQKIFFCCLQPADTGGETPLADCRRVYQRLSAQVRFALKDGYTYVRNFRDSLGLSWQETFGTSSAADVEAYCRANDIAYVWRNGFLQTRQVRNVLAKHPGTGELSWFNHLTFFHVSTLPADIQHDLRAICDDDFPHNTYHADGRDIDPAIMEEVRSAYLQERVAFTWQQGDVIMVDNVLVSHGRMPFTGSRSVVVGMADPCTWTQVRA